MQLNIKFTIDEVKKLCYITNKNLGDKYESHSSNG